jgi:subtilisin-like proprotein convertase family protein
MHKYFYTVFLLIAFPLLLKAQTFTSSPNTLIPDGGPTVTFPITVSGLNPAAIDTVFGLETVCINITHTWDADLNISLQAPDGAIIDLSIGNGGSDDDYANTCFNANAPGSIVAGNAPFTGSFIPQGSLGNINNGQNGNGTWQLVITDTYAADQGTLLSWSLTFGNNPAAPPFSFSSSNLPIVVINTNNQAIPNEPKIMADMGVIYNGPAIRNYMTDPFNEYNGKIGIEARGSSSSGFPQRSYGIETIDAAWNKVDSSLLGMPKEHDWILYAPYDDKTLMRNALTYKLCREMGHWASRTRFCELVIDGQYQGVYVLMEKIKRDNKRVDISKILPTDNSGDALTGGYIIKIDKQSGNGGAGWTSPYAPAVSSSGQTIYFQYDYPSDAGITSQQQSYIQQYVDSFETALASPGFADPATGFRKYADESSFIDYCIINEISKNVDGYRLSSYLYKDRYSKGGKLTAGPAWDYNLGWWNADYCDGDNYTGWALMFGNACGGDSWQVPFWWERMFQDTNFANNVHCRWENLRGNLLSNVNLYHLVDSMATFVNEAKTRHFITWPILGTYTWPNPSPIPATYAEEITALKTWINNRTSWIDQNLPGHCYDVRVTEGAAINVGMNVYPNPFTNAVTVSFTAPAPMTIRLELFNSLGEKIRTAGVSAKAGSNEEVFDLSAMDLAPGMYIVKLSAGSFTAFKRITRTE